MQLIFLDKDTYLQRNNLLVKVFPLKNFKLPLRQGLFLAKRKHEFHTGVDLYAPEREPVYSAFSGIVTKVEQFTGDAVGSPWWNDTQAVYVLSKENKKIIYVYGEILPCVKVGDAVEVGQMLGRVQKVIKVDKGLPTSMLHLEKYIFGRELSEKEARKFTSIDVPISQEHLTSVPLSFLDTSYTLEDALYDFTFSFLLIRRSNKIFKCDENLNDVIFFQGTFENMTAFQILKRNDKTTVFILNKDKEYLSPYFLAFRNGQVCLEL